MVSELTEEAKQKLYREEMKKMNRMMDLFYMADEGIKKSRVVKPTNKYDGGGKITQEWKDFQEHLNK